MSEKGPHIETMEVDEGCLILRMDDGTSITVLAEPLPSITRMRINQLVK